MKMTGTNNLLILLLSLLGTAKFICCEQKCLYCRDAQGIAECTTSITCGSGEYCYTEEVVTSNGILYNAGCKASGACIKNTGSTGKRSVDALVACAQCCQGGDRNESTVNCNRKLCGLPSSAPLGLRNLTTCYHCEKVTDPDMCNNLITCQADQICGVKTEVKTGAIHEYSFDCYPKTICLEATKRILKYAESAEITVGKRVVMNACSLCCGGSYCNTADCVVMAKKLISLDLSGHLDKDTLMYKTSP